MYVLDVIPLSRTAPDVLSYRSLLEMPVGSVVDIMLRKTSTQGIVVACTPIADAKEMIKHARFMLSRSAPSPSGILPAPIMQAAERVALWHASSVGAVLTALFSEYINSGATFVLENFEGGPCFSEIRVELPVTARAADYRTRIDGVLATGKSVLLVVPTVTESTFWKREFSHYKPLLLSGAVTGSKRKAALEMAATHTRLIIATPSFSWAPISALGLIIVDRVSAGTYTLPKRPYIHVPRALQCLAEARRLPIAYGDYPLPLEYRKDTSVLTSSGPAIQMVDMRKDPDDQHDAGGSWSIFTEDVLQSIAEELLDGRVVILASRAGYSPAVVCRDCGQALADDRGMPLSFTMAGGKRVFRTSDGKTVLDARMRCPRCESWNLLPLGIGQERVVEELQKHFPQTPIIDASAERLRSLASAKKVVEESAALRSITVGSEALLPWLLLHTATEVRQPLGIIASADSLLSLPFWRSRERFVRLCYLFSGLCKHVMLLTRRPEDTAVRTVTGSDAEAFWKEEDELRRTLAYPPYGTLITIMAEGSEEALNEVFSAALKAFEKYTPHYVPDMPTGKSSVRRTVVLSLPQGVWPDEELSLVLQQLPLMVRVRIDPDSIW